VSDAGDAYEVQMTLPADLVKLASGPLPEPVRAHGELYVPCELGAISIAASSCANRRPPASSAWT
jgi:hypothetical protein